MTTKLEELFNLPYETKSGTQTKNLPDISAEDANKLMNSVDKIDAALPLVKDLEANDKEMEDIAKEAMTTFSDLMDLGFNTDPRFSGKIFEVASTMMKNAIDARTAKIDKKLKMIELQIKKARVDKMPNAGSEQDDQEKEGTIVFDRNELLRELIKKTKE